MPEITDEMKLQAVALLGLTVVQAIKAAGPLGLPGGTIYAGLMAHGCTYEQYEKLMAILVQSGKLRRAGQLYIATEKA